MAVKQGGKTVQINGGILDDFRRALQAEGWTWGATKKIESLLQDYSARILGADKKHHEFMVADRPQRGETPGAHRVAKTLPPKLSGDAPLAKPRRNKAK